MSAIVKPNETVDLSGLKRKQQAAWSSGDYSVGGTTLQIVGESLCEALDLPSVERVLDVAAANGNVHMAAARRRRGVGPQCQRRSKPARSDLCGILKPNLAALQDPPS